MGEAKKYQAKFSGDANLSFEHKGVSFDDFKDGVLVDAKYGHGSSIFSEDDFGDIQFTNPQRLNKIQEQAERQLKAIEGTNLKIEWHISTELGATGIKEFFSSKGITQIVVKYTPL